MSGIAKLGGTLGAALLAVLLIPGTTATAAAQTPANSRRSRKTCCRSCSARVRSATGPDTAAPMSLLTYQEVRPWVRAIKQRVSTRADAAVAHRPQHRRVRSTIRR